MFGHMISQDLSGWCVEGAQGRNQSVFQRFGGGCESRDEEGHKEKVEFGLGLEGKCNSGRRGPKH